MATNVFPVDAVAGVPQYTGRETRQVLSALVAGASVARPLGGRSGVCAGPTSVVSASGGNWTVGLHNGILDLETAVESGVYFYANDAVTTPSAITAAHATYARKDIVYVKLDDPAETDGSSVPAATFQYLVGPADGTTNPPATPARSMVLGYINVPNAGGGGASSATVTQVWPYATAVGGVITVRTIAERDLITHATASNPVHVDCLADGQSYRNAGSGWVRVSGTAIYGEATGPGAGRTVNSATLTDLGTQTVGTNLGSLLTASGTTGSNPGVTVARSGIYSIHQYVAFLTATSGRSFVQLLVGGTVVDRQVCSGEDIATCSVPAIQLTAGNLITAQAFQSSGAPININSQIRVALIEAT